MLRLTLCAHFVISDVSHVRMFSMNLSCIKETFGLGSKGPLCSQATIDRFKKFARLELINRR